MIPTQIDAAALRKWQDVITQAMACIRGETPEDISFGEAEDDTYSKLKQVDVEISAALTAAAEAGEKWTPDIHGTKSEIWDTAVAQTEAKLRAADFAAKHNFDGWQQEIKRSEELEAATIERCAQTVHNLQQRADADREYIFAFNDAIREAVSAIRAIKDKP